MVRVGIAGFGFMGRMHFRCWQNLDGFEVAAVCDANPSIVEDVKKETGNIEGAASAVDFDRIRLFADFHEMIAEGKLDALSLTLPTFMHADATVKALDAGLHVLCEKPMALTVADCDRMIAAAERSGKVLQIGHCVRFWPEFAFAKKAVAGGEHGRVVAATFQRLSKAPLWSWDGWFMDEKRSGGMILDLHIHDTDYVNYLFGKTRAVVSRAGRWPGGSLAHVVTQYIFDQDMAVTAEGGWSMMPSFDFEMSFNIMMEKATLAYDCTRDPVFRVCPLEGDAFTPEVEAGDGYSRQIEHFAKRIQGEPVEEVLTLEGSRDAIRVSDAIRESAQKGVMIKLS
jgi:predicted dehydrogenase